MLDGIVLQGHILYIKTRYSYKQYLVRALHETITAYSYYVITYYIHTTVKFIQLYYENYPIYGKQLLAGTLCFTQVIYSFSVHKVNMNNNNKNSMLNIQEERLILNFHVCHIKAINVIIWQYNCMSLKNKIM